MIFLLSPAKTLDYETKHIELKPTQPAFLEQSQLLINQLKELTSEDIASLMKLSEKLADLNHQRYHSWTKVHTESSSCRPALLAFKGDVYQGLNAGSFSEDDFAYAQQHLRILSGLYGLLKPLDLMQAYRLEMGTKFANTKGKNLYDFWDHQLTDSLNQEQPSAIINLASNEYFSSVKKKQLEAPLITPVFKDFKNGKYKIISFYAKKARGTMAAWALKNKIETVNDLRNFSEDGYAICPEQSNEATLTFLRNIEA